jgi:hypothetical protein
MVHPRLSIVSHTAENTALNATNVWLLSRVIVIMSKERDWTRIFSSFTSHPS